MPIVCISMDALEAGLRFPLHPIIEECIRWWRISPSQVAPNSWRYLVVFLGECRGAEIIPTRDLFMACFRLCKSRGGYYFTACVSFRVSGAPSNNKDQMDLGDLRGMPKVSGGKTPSVRAVVPAREVGVSPAGEAPKTSSKRLTETPNEQTDDPDHRHKKVKILSRRHKSCHGEGGSQSHFKGKEPAASVKVPETLVEFAEEDASPVHHHPRSMKDLFKTKVQKDDVGYYALYLSDLAHQDPDKEMQARWGKLKNSTKQEIDALKSGGGPEVVIAAEERASKLEKELEKMKRERDEMLQRLDASNKELNEARGDLSKALESARAELPRQAVDDYKELADFKKGLKRMGRVIYEYGYRVALARFHSLHPDSEVKEDPFTVRPEDDSASMERQQAFDDPDPPEP
ncbi:hypothetical protein BHM03_00058538 [Ensete ventricosum]|nr:hypothetical protein BHM03_00058538 [Ensete ventricosum]